MEDRTDRDDGRTHPASALLAGLVCLGEGVGLAYTAWLYLAELVAGEATESGTATMALVVTAIFAVVLVVMALAWWRERRWPRTPTIVANLLLLPAIYTLHTTNGPTWSVPLLVLALTGIVAALLSPAPELPEDTAL